MLHKAREFGISDSSFTDIQTQHVDHSTHYQFNISVTSDGIRARTVETPGYHLDLETWQEMISKANELIREAKNGNEILMSETSGGPPSVSMAPTLIDETDECPDVTPENEHQQKAFQEVERRLTIYTGVDKAMKKLKRSINIAFTLMPVTTHGSAAPGNTLIWKVLHFEKTATMRHQIKWTDRTGFCSVEEIDGGKLQPGALRSIVEPGDIKLLQTIEGDDEFRNRMGVPFEAGEMRAVWNMTGNSQRLALCSIDLEDEESDQFSPVLDLDVGDFFVCGPPVMLQAFVVPTLKQYQEGKPIDARTLLRPLFVNPKTSAPEPINVTKLSKAVTAFRLYSDTAGKIVLEKDN